VCPETSAKRKSEQKEWFREELAEDALTALIESIRHRSGLLNIYKTTPNNAEPDIR